MNLPIDTAVTVPVNICPLTDDTDFKTRETAIAYNESGMALYWNFETLAGVTSRTQVTPTTGGDYDWTHLGGGMYTIEIPASGGASINNDTAGFGYFDGVCDGVLSWRSPTFGFGATANVGKLNDSELALKVLAYRNYAERDDAVALVEPTNGDTDAQKGTKLENAYTAAKSLTPGGNAISEANRARVLIPPHHYDCALTADTSGIDLIPLVPEKPARRKLSDEDKSDGTQSWKSYRPQSTVIYSGTDGVTPLTQSCVDIHMHGFTVAQVSNGTSDAHGLFVSETGGGDGSWYSDMNFWHRRPLMNDTYCRTPVGFEQDVRGLWEGCTSNALGWRVGYGHTNSIFCATMIDVWSGKQGIGGDYLEEDEGTQKMTLSWFEDCGCMGYTSSQRSGFGGFAGCGTWGLDIDDNCIFLDCYSGPNSYGIGKRNKGLYFNCIGRENCYGATTGTTFPGEFAGVAWHSYGEGASFGGQAASDGYGLLTGQLYWSVSTGSDLPWRVGINTMWAFESYTPPLILGSVLWTTGADEDCITLIDPSGYTFPPTAGTDYTPVICDSALLVENGGTGKPINAGSELEVIAIGNQYSNSGASGQTNGLGSNVTNVGNPATVTTDSASREASKADTSGLGTAANQTTIINTLGTPAGDSVSADIAGIVGAAGGEGAFTGTLTVDDGEGTGLEGAVVIARRGGVLIASGTTDSSGEITDWVFGAYTYDLAVRLAGYQPTTDTITVSADAWTKTVSLTALSITAPDDASLCTVQFRVKLSATAVSGAVCKARLLGTNQAANGTILSPEELSDTTDSEGVAELQLVQKGSIVKGDGRYKIWTEIAGKTVASVETVIPNQSTILFEDLLGA